MERSPPHFCDASATRLTDDGQLRRITLFDEDACTPLVEAVHAARASWSPRGPGFFTLGAACYLDLCRVDLDAYLTLARAANPVLRACLGRVHEAIRAVIEDLVGGACHYDERFALPGVHVFEAASLTARLRDNLHLDLQHAYLPLGLEPETPSFTFTLPLQLPAAGGGIEICDRMVDPPRGRMVVHPYRLGELFFHTGRALHRRAHYPAGPRCARITVQGHGARIDGRWLLYW